MSVFDQAAKHEQVVFCRHEPSGLRAIIAIYSTALGPALGGTRFYRYPDESTALHDVLELSRAMAYKAACAGLPLGGGKAVILGDPRRVKTDALLRAYGQFVGSLGGRYYTACDIGTNVDDMAIIAQECRYVAGRPTADGGAGDSSVLTAYGVACGMRASAEFAWNEPTLRGRRVGILGVGKVGQRLIELLLADEASVVVADVDRAAVQRVQARHPEVDACDPDKLFTSDLDVFAPCAMGGVLDDETAHQLQAEVTCGAANNQLAHAGIDALLWNRGVRYAPDYVVNAGGLIQVAREVHGYDSDTARSKTERIFDTTRMIFETAVAEAVPTGQAADAIAERRLSLRTAAVACADRAGS